MLSFQMLLMVYLLLSSESAFSEGIVYSTADHPVRLVVGFAAILTSLAAAGCSPMSVFPALAVALTLPAFESMIGRSFYVPFFISGLYLSVRTAVLFVGFVKSGGHRPVSSFAKAALDAQSFGVLFVDRAGSTSLCNKVMKELLKTLFGKLSRRMDSVWEKLEGYSGEKAVVMKNDSERLTVSVKGGDTYELSKETMMISNRPYLRIIAHNITKSIELSEKLKLTENIISEQSGDYRNACLAQISLEREKKLLALEKSRFNELTAKLSDISDALSAGEGIQEFRAKTEELIEKCTSCQELSDEALLDCIISSFRPMGLETVFDKTGVSSAKLKNVTDVIRECSILMCDFFETPKVSYKLESGEAFVLFADSDCFETLTHEKAEEFVTALEKNLSQYGNYSAELDGVQAEPARNSRLRCWLVED